MFLHSGGRISLRVAVALLIPVGIVFWLLYAAASDEEDTHSRNLRWLAQMATQIHQRVQNYSNFVRDRAHVRGTAGAALKARSDAQPYSIENLVPLSRPASCNPRSWPHLSVVDEGHERQLRFLQTSGRFHECAQADLKKLVESSIRKDAFTSVVLAQRNGRVLYQSGPESLRITDVSFLFENPYSAPTSSIHITRQVGDTKFAIFVQPLPLLLHGEMGTTDSDWILIGLSEKRNLLRSCSPKDMMLVLPLALLLAAMSWPLQRLWMMSPAEPLRRKDVTVIVLCSLGAVIVITLLGVSEYSRQFSKARADEQLRAFAESIGSHFKAELQLAIRQLRRLDNIASQENAQSKASILEHSLDWKDVYLPFEYADWINSDGEKTIRWTPKRTPPQRVNVVDRGYFQDIKLDTALFLPDISPEKFAIEQVLSRTSGQAATMIAIASKLKQSDVASLAVNFVSLSDPVAPRDLGFAIIDVTGRVLFHSERSRMFVENLFDECRQSRELSGVVSRRIQAYVDVDYAATPYRMFVTPLPHAERVPWTLVVFRKLPPNRIARMQVLVDASVLLCAYAVCLSVLLAIGFLLLPREALQLPSVSSTQWWLASEPGYPHLAGVGLLVAFIVWRAFSRLHDSELFYASLASAVAFVAITAIGLHSPAVTCRRRVLLRMAGVLVVIVALSLYLHDWFMAVTAPLAVLSYRMLISREFPHSVLKNTWLVWGLQAVFVLSVAPTLFLFKMSHEFETGLRMRDSQWRLWDAETQRRGALIRGIENIPGVGGNSEMRRQLLAAVGVSDLDDRSVPLYYYGKATSRIKLFPSMGSPSCVPGEAGRVSERVHAENGLPRSILAAMELPSEDRLVGFDARHNALQPARNLWKWTENEGFLCLYSDADMLLARARLPIFDPFRGRQDTVQASSVNDEQSTEIGQSMSAVPAWIGLVALLGAVGLWIQALRRRLLLIAIPGMKVGSCASSADAYTFIAANAVLMRGNNAPRRTPNSLPAYAIALLIVGLVLFLSEEEMTTRLIAFLTTVTAGFEAIRKQLAGFHRDSDETKKS